MGMREWGAAAGASAFVGVCLTAAWPDQDVRCDRLNLFQRLSRGLSQGWGSSSSGDGSTCTVLAPATWLAGAGLTFVVLATVLLGLRAVGTSRRHRGHDERT